MFWYPNPRIPGLKKNIPQTVTCQVSLGKSARPLLGAILFLIRIQSEARLHVRYTPPR